MHGFDMAVSNCWLEYKNNLDIAGISKQMNLLDFKTTLAEELISVGRPTPPKKRGRPSSSPSSNITNRDISLPIVSKKCLEFRPLPSVALD